MPLLLDSEYVGTVHRFGYEIKFGIFPQYQKLFATKFRKAINAYIRELLEEPMVTARVPLDQSHLLKLIPRMGFVETHQDENCAYFTLEKVPFERTHDA